MRIYYTEVCLSPYEVPNEQSLCIYISGCRETCCNCHYPELRKNNFGTPLGMFFNQLLELYFHQATCVCFLGEGENTSESRTELITFAKQAEELGKRTCLYSGRDVELEDWMKVFDYVKLGSFQERFGALDSPTTNQIFYQRCSDGTYKNIAELFRD